MYWTTRRPCLGTSWLCPLMAFLHPHTTAAHTHTHTSALSGHSYAPAPALRPQSLAHSKKAAWPSPHTCAPLLSLLPYKNRPPNFSLPRRVHFATLHARSLKSYHRLYPVVVEKLLLRDAKKTLHTSSAHHRPHTFTDFSASQPTRSFSHATKMPKAAAGKRGAKEVKRRGKKDPNAPKRGLSAYMFFANEQRENVREENPGISFGQVGKILGRCRQEEIRGREASVQR
ncbi:hypothetical protein XA68_16513 [Ophiocordyceps unilateralis]|uniref:HMG box domain-containing protein n=1 Tax=Ophiocordyceps unilateralis TaxID=268505 RepID=A0A2A9PLE1_OPHUN|nr:hypothetical protein XA68_16513 [Ophiocordyceps unilateralis]